MCKTLSAEEWKKQGERNPKAICLWGQAEDVCVTLNGHPLVLDDTLREFAHDPNTKVALEGTITGRQAIHFALQLLDAGSRALELDAGLREADIQRLVGEHEELEVSEETADTEDLTDAPSHKEDFIGDVTRTEFNSEGKREPG